MASDDPRYQQDLAIARAILASDEEVATRFFEENNERLYAFILSRCRDADESADLLQETWVTAIERLDAYQGESALLTWICGIARHKVLDRHRARGRDQRLTRVSEFEQVFGRVLVGQGQPDDVLELLEAQEVREVLASTLALLPEEYRVGLTRKYLERQSVREIASELGRSEKATESLLARARAAFRDLWLIESGQKESLRRGSRGSAERPDGRA